MAKVVLFLLVLLMTIGIWHAWPLTSVVYDEGYYAGGVLRAMSARSVLPQGTDVPYGVLNYFGSYVLMSVLLVILLPFAHFSLAGLTAFLVGHQWLAYLPGRVISLLAFIALIYATERFWRKYVREEGDRLALLVLTFSTLLVVAQVHTGKLWGLSTFLLLVSFMSLVRAERADRYAFISIFTAFVVAVNFPIMAVALINVPILFWTSRSSKQDLKRLAMFTLVGACFALILLICDLAGIKYLFESIINGYTLSPQALANNFSPISSLGVNIYRSLRYFPLLFIALLVALYKGGRSLRLSRYGVLSLVYFCVYIGTISFVARWSTDFHSFVRYLMPLAFFTTHLTASVWQSRLPALKPLAGASLALGLFLTGLVARPTTFNLAYNYVARNFKSEHLVIDNEASPELSLPMNKESYALLDDKFCGTTCQFVRGSAPAPDFLPVVINEQSIASTSLLRRDYVVTNHPVASLGTPYAQFESGASTVETYAQGLIIDNVADYFDKDFWQLRNLGRSIYFYKSR